MKQTSKPLSERMYKRTMNLYAKEWKERTDALRKAWGEKQVLHHKGLVDATVKKMEDLQRLWDVQNGRGDDTAGV